MQKKRKMHAKILDSVCNDLNTDILNWTALRGVRLCTSQISFSTSQSAYSCCQWSEENMKNIVFMCAEEMFCSIWPGNFMVSQVGR